MEANKRHTNWENSARHKVKEREREKDRENEKKNETENRTEPNHTITGVLELTRCRVADLEHEHKLS